VRGASPMKCQMYCGVQMDDFSDRPLSLDEMVSDGDDQSLVEFGVMAKKARDILRARVGEDFYVSWFKTLDFVRRDGSTLHVSVPTQFLKKWVQQQFAEVLLTCSKDVFVGINRVEVSVRTPAAAAPAKNAEPAARSLAGDEQRPALRAAPQSTHGLRAMPAPNLVRTQVNGFEGSPLDPRCTFENFLVGPSNRMAHAAAIQVAETVFAAERGFNPLFLHANVGLGKSHLLHAIAWEVQRRTPNAKVLYLTAERFRFQFVDAIKSQDAMAFKDRFRSIDILLIDDFEYMQGDKTEQEFEHIVNALIDGGRQVVVASARPPAQIERLNDRMRSRLSRGLVSEIQPLDQELRLRILERRVTEKRGTDPLFEIPRQVLDLLADKLTENGRELEGAVNRLYAQWQLSRQAVTLEMIDGMMRDLVGGGEPRRVKIDDILRAVSRHFAVSKQDILSQRRHRSVVWPRQVGMYLAKQLTSRSLPEIGRRFGDRDHTTVLHAIRKIDKELENNTRLRDDLDELKRQLNR
jgi:chromosomal replication initiator protein